MGFYVDAAGCGARTMGLQGVAALCTVVPITKATLLTSLFQCHKPASDTRYWNVGTVNPFMRRIGYKQTKKMKDVSFTRTNGHVIKQPAICTPRVAFTQRTVDLSCV